MSHLSEGTLRRMFDDPDAHAGAEARHLETCAECQARYKTVAADAGAITTLMAAPELKVDVVSAFKRLQSAPAARPRFGIRLPLFRPSARPMLLLAAATGVLLALLVTAVAQDGNVLFTPQKVTTVPVTVADMQALSQLGEYGDLTWTTKPDLHVVSSAGEAQTIAGGLKPPTVASLPAGVSTTVTYAATPKAVAVFTFDKDKAAAAAVRAGKKLPALPAGIDGAKLTVTLGPAVAEVYGDMKQATTDAAQMHLPQLVVAASNAPVASSTQVTVKQMEDYILSVPGISPELSNAIKALGDPSRTLVIPIPIQFASSSKVTVQKVDGVALGDNTGVGAGVIWVKSGVVYVVAGTVKKDDALDIANHLT